MIIDHEQCVLRGIRRRAIALKDLARAVCHVEKKQFGLVLVSGETITIPWKLIDNPSAACQVFQSHGVDVVDANGIM